MKLIQLIILLFAFNTLEAQVTPAVGHARSVINRDTFIKHVYGETFLGDTLTDKDKDFLVMWADVYRNGTFTMKEDSTVIHDTLYSKPMITMDGTIRYSPGTAVTVQEEANVLTITATVADGTVDQNNYNLGGVMELTKEQIGTMLNGIQGSTGNEFITLTPHVLSSKIKCKDWIEYTEWVSPDKEYKQGGVVHVHTWVDAEWDDVNSGASILNMVYCVCGCDYSTEEARICKVCLRHETRNKIQKHGIDNTESEYIQLLKKKQ